jgi:hypothetical protein
MPRVTKKFIFLLAAFIATSAQAQSSSFYFGFDGVMPYGATWKVVNTPDEKLSVGTQFKPTLGYAFNDRYAIEIGRFSVNASKDSFSESITINPVNLVYSTPFSTQTSLLLKGGIAPFHAEFRHPSLNTSHDLVGLSLGIGLKYQISPSVGLVGGVDFLNGYKATLENIGEFSLSPANAYWGLRFGF